MRAKLRSWRDRKTCRKRELLSLIGILSHVCMQSSKGGQVVPAETNRPLNGAELATTQFHVSECTSPVLISSGGAGSVRPGMALQ